MFASHSLVRFAAPLTLALFGLAAGCGDDAATTADSTTSTTGSTTNAGGGGQNAGGAGTGGAETGGGETGGGGSTAAPEFVAHLDPTKGELAEGLFVKDDVAYVGLAGLGSVVKISLPGGDVSAFGSIPAPPANSGFLLGLVVDGGGNVIVGFGGGPGDPVKNGLYKIAPGGSVTTPFATDAEMNFPNGLFLDGSGDVFVADSGGAIFRVKSDGTTTKWASDPLLQGNDTSCMFGAPFPLGANGIVEIGDAFYVANTNLGSIVKIPIKGDGTAGTASVFAGPSCDVLGGIDGIDVAPDGKTILGVLNGKSQLVAIDDKGQVEVVFSGAPLDNPASIVVSKGNGYITNSAFFNQEAPAPGLLSIGLE